MIVGYCPECGKELDGSEFSQYHRMCADCFHRSEHEADMKYEFENMYYGRFGKGV